MPLRRALLTVGFALLASLALSFGLWAMADNPAAVHVMGVAWEERPASVNELHDLSAATVEAEVQKVVAGPDLVSPEPNESGRVTRIPTQRVLFKTLQTLDGQAPAAFTLFKTGSEIAYLQDDPFYRAGERYVLFIRPRHSDPGTYLPVAPDGRLREDSQGKVDGFIPGPVEQDLQGQTAAQIKQEIR